MRIKSTSFKDDGPAKKAYESPRLVVYGDIREITKSVGMTSATGDGATHGNTKTA